MKRRHIMLVAVAAAAIVVTMVAVVPVITGPDSLLAAEGVHFLEAEAGPALYMNADQTLNLALAKSALRTVEVETPTYVIGSMEVPSFASPDEDVHVYVHVDGWIVVYYLRHEPLTKIVDIDYWSGGKFTATKLDEGMDKICSTLLVSSANVKKFHFRHPEADNWQIIARHDGTFNMYIPDEFAVYERSWYTDRGYTSRFYLNDEVFYSPDGPAGFLSWGQLPPGEFHSVQSYSGRLVAIGLVYREP